MPRRTVVIGGGLTGIEAARGAAERGHIVRLFDGLRAASANDPRVDPGGPFALARIGDAVASRNLHAVIYGAARLVQGLDRAERPGERR